MLQVCLCLPKLPLLIAYITTIVVSEHGCRYLQDFVLRHLYGTVWNKAYEKQNLMMKWLEQTELLILTTFTQMCTWRPKSVRKPVFSKNCSLASFYHTKNSHISSMLMQDWRSVLNVFVHSWEHWTCDSHLKFLQQVLRTECRRRLFFKFGCRNTSLQSDLLRYQNIKTNLMLKLQKHLGFLSYMNRLTAFLALRQFEFFLHILPLYCKENMALCRSPLYLSLHHALPCVTF